MGCHIGSILLHASKLVDIEEGIIYPYSFLLKKYRHAIFYKNRKCYQNENW
jgi:hypothetical protein